MDEVLDLDVPTLDEQPDTLELSTDELAALLESEAPVLDEAPSSVDDDEGLQVNSELESHVNDDSLGALSKKEAKALGKLVYKRWKKLHKKSKKSSKKEEHKTSKKEHKSKKDLVEKRHQTEDDKTTKTSNYTDVAAARTPKMPKVKSSATKTSTKVTQAQKLELAREIASKLVSTMVSLRKEDEKARQCGTAPLSRYSVVDDVVLHCRRRFMHQALIEAGILGELCCWIYDSRRRELGPLDLRTAALELLMLFDVCGTSSHHKNEFKAKKSESVDDLEVWRGITRADLEKTNLGLALFALRDHAQETQRNKNIVVKLLSRFGRAFNKNVDEGSDDEEEVEVVWKHKGDPNVAAPFDPVRASSDVFQQRVTQVDPLDPMSYLRVPPTRYQKGYVTNLSHIKLT